MPPDATETKRRILVAARREFAQHGLAGARIDRIAEQAMANKRSIYVHFGPKEHLFDLVVIDALAAMSLAVPFTADDLPGYAGRLFDFLLADPETLRLSTWATLERPQATETEADAYRVKVDQLREVYGADAVDVLVLVLGLVTALPVGSPALLSLGEPRTTPEALAVHRALLVEGVASLIAGLGGSASA
ncbi:AcrR family transcriptional regulator [Microbacterium resistens]|uniref:AcrR family transcriptional regulator n=1 Tax=Microbacterium resistens TaxID=156977 RepID=A0ABU1SB53_9MICO|nr:TetR family transcriptional regulator [Microbacterium resistens]MDR6866829.1 AcrR family transcriptional regulator [Microbacterium resistens]